MAAASRNPYHVFESAATIVLLSEDNHYTYLNNRHIESIEKTHLLNLNLICNSSQQLAF